MSDGASAAVSKGPTVPDPLIGRVISGRFKITSLIARGGMGKVYRAEQAPLGRVCAIKVLSPGSDGRADPDFHKRFFLEASIASRLTHPNTVTIFDYGRTEDDIFYMAMEYLDGRTLHRAVRQAGFLPEDRAAHIARQVCRALGEAHAAGVIHRDLKPANVLLVEHGDEPDFVKVLDFGLVKNISETKNEELTQAGLFMGSPKYMAPEQIRGERVDARTDIYALGVILYEMVTGKVPFDRPSSVQILMAHVHDALPALRQANPQANVSQALEETIRRCMAKSPDQRFASMDEVLASLKRVPAPGLAPNVRNASPPQPPSGSGAHALPSPTGSGPTFSVAAPGESGTKAILPALAPPMAVAQAFSLPPHPVRKSPRAFGFTVIGVVTAIAGGGGYAAFRPGGLAAPSSMAPPSPGAVPASSATHAATVLPRPDLIVKVRITTDPDGATVKENGIELCSSTPCDVLYADADPSRVHDISVSLAGYRPEAKSIRVGDSPIVVKLTAE
ncbi:MAG: protein kinase [Polyangiaceae bacterium]|jgi:serine/threonine-protein kinase